MDTSLDLRTERLNLLLAPRNLMHSMVTTCIARLALEGTVWALDGGDCFAARQVARTLRRQGSALEDALERIRLARAFTCYQMVALLAETPPSPAPILVLELLATFQDENVSLAERQRLLGQSLAHLRRLSSRAAVLVTASLPLERQIDGLLQDLEEAADHVWRFENPVVATAQYRLF
jgi:hypothetical protein